MEIEFTKVFVSYIRRYVLTAWYVESITPDKTRFSSPIFGDMFLLITWEWCTFYTTRVFVSYIRRYVLTKFQRKTWINESKMVFVSYIRRYVLTFHELFNLAQKVMFSSPIFGDMFLLSHSLTESKSLKTSFRLLYSEICSY